MRSLSRWHRLRLAAPSLAADSRRPRACLLRTACASVESRAPYSEAFSNFAGRFLVRRRGKIYDSQWQFQRFFDILTPKLSTAARNSMTDREDDGA
jgi:hypothetical protein